MNKLFEQLEQKIASADISGNDREELLEVASQLQKKSGKLEFMLESLVQKGTTTKGLLTKFIQEIENKNAQIQKYADELKKANDTKDRFFSIIAHDLRNPFNTILGFSALLKTNVERYDKKKIQSFADSMYKTTSLTMQLLIDLLDWARSQRNQMRIIPEQLYVNQIIKNNVLLMKEQAEKKSLHIEYQGNKDIFAFADLYMINAIIRNLISNAIKFTKSGKVAIKTEQLSDHCTISIIDSGIGIPPEVLKNLFKVEVGTSGEDTDGEKGTGLGLILCKEFVEANNGTISVQSTVNQGSTFSFTIPLFSENNLLTPII